MTDIAERERKGKLKELIDEIIHDLDSPPPTISTGLPRLDEMMDGGIRPGEVCLVAARPGVGKSAFALQVALETMQYDRPVSIWTLEMSKKAWTRRAIAMLSGVNPKKLRTGGDVFSPDEIARITGAMELFHKLPLSFAEGRTDPAGFAMEADIQAGRGRAELLIVDYIQLMDPPQGAFTRENEVAQLSRTIKQTAIGLDIPILALAQLNRNAENKIPTLADLRESGSLEADADEVFFLHRNRDPDTQRLDDHGLGILGKNRDGETGMVRLRYNWRAYRFEQEGHLTTSGAA